MTKLADSYDAVGSLAKALEIQIRKTLWLAERLESTEKHRFAAAGFLLGDPANREPWTKEKYLECAESYVRKQMEALKDD